MTQSSRTCDSRDVHVIEDTCANFQESTQRRHRSDAPPLNTRCEPVSVNNSNRNNQSVAQVIQGIPESIEHSQHSIKETQSIDMNALREEIKETISATNKEKL